MAAHWSLPVVRLIALLYAVTAGPLNGGCSCIYNAAERKMTLARPVDPDRVQAVLRSTAGVEEVSDPQPAGTGRLFFVIPIGRTIYHNFRWSGPLYGTIEHKEGGAELDLRASTVNHRPDEQTRVRARMLLDELERRLWDAEPPIPANL